MFGFNGMSKLAAVAILAVGGMFMVPAEAQASDVHVRLGVNGGSRYYAPPVVVQPRYYSTTPYYSQPYYSQPYYYSQPNYSSRYYSAPRYYSGRDNHNNHQHHDHNRGGHNQRGHNHRR